MFITRESLQGFAFKSVVTAKATFKHLAFNSTPTECKGNPAIPVRLGHPVEYVLNSKQNPQI